MIVQRLPESRDPRVPYTRLAEAECAVREVLHAHEVDRVHVRGVWNPSGANDVLVEVTNIDSLRSCVVRP